MNVKTLRERLAAFDDGTEICISPLMSATRIGEEREMLVPHPLRHYPIVSLSVVGDIPAGRKSADRRRAVLTFSEDAALAVETVDHRIMRVTGSGYSGSMGWVWACSDDLNFARVQLAGTFHAAGFDVMFSELARQKCVVPGRRVLFDDRLLDLSDAGEADINATSEIFARNASAFERTKIAIVMGSVRDYQLACTFEAMTTARIPAMLHPFLDENEALIWLHG
jgi:hypothetical protein